MIIHCEHCGRFKGKGHECPKTNPMQGKKRPDLSSYNTKTKKGKKLSIETRAKMSNAMMGEKNPFYGLKHSKITKTEISQNNREYYKTHHPPNWEGGHSKNRKYSLGKWLEIAKECYKRDNWTCQICGTNNTLIHAHHIISWAKNSELAFDLDNLVTLCPSCHFKIHRKSR